MTTKKQYITFLSLFASLAVVLLHTNGCFWRFSFDRYWLTANVIESLFYFAAPAFFMITGATLIGYREKYDTKTYFKKRFAKIVIPFLVWSLLFVLLSVALKKLSFSDLTLIDLFNNIFNTKYISVYWFFISLAAIYFAIPVLAAIPKQSRRSVFKYIIITSIVLNCLLPLLFSLTNGKLVYNSGLSMPLGLKFLIYPIMGYYIDNYEMSKKTRIAVYLCGAFGLCLILFGTWFLSYDAGKIVSTFKEYGNLPCVMYSAAVFLAFNQIRFDKVNKTIMKIVNFFAPATFGIYLMHMFFIEFLVTKNLVDKYSIIYRVGGAIVIFLVSGIITRLIQKIPVLKKIIP